MSEPSFDYTAPGRYDKDVLTLVGVLVAACGSIERALFDALLYYRNEGAEVGPIAMDFKRRHQQWLKHVLADLKGAPKEVQAIPSELHKRTAALFNFRHILFHSRWMGQDNAGTLWVSAVKEKRGKLLTLDVPIPKKHMARNLLIAEHLWRDHLRFQVEVVLRYPQDRVREFFLMIDADPKGPTHPSQTGLPYRREAP